MCRRFGLEWNFVSSRNSKKLYYIRVTRKISYIRSSIGKSLSITCGCSGLVRFKDVERDTCSNTNPVVITDICEVQSYTCDPFLCGSVYFGADPFY